MRLFSFLFVFSMLVLINTSCKESTEQASTKEANKTSVTNSQKTITAQKENKAHPAKITAKQTKGKANEKHSKDNHLSVGGMDWLSIEDAAALKDKSDKKYLIDVYTDWCGWCKVMDKKTFTDPEVQAYLKENFHIVKFNAEQKNPIEWEGKSYEWVKTGRKGVNTLAQKLLGGRLGYPTMVYLDENKQLIKSSPGYKDPTKLLAELKQL